MILRIFAIFLLNSYRGYCAERTAKGDRFWVQRKKVGMKQKAGKIDCGIWETSKYRDKKR
jgi:hypothetical protein